MKFGAIKGPLYFCRLIFSLFKLGDRPTLVKKFVQGHKVSLMVKLGLKYKL